MARTAYFALHPPGSENRFPPPGFVYHAALQNGDAHAGGWCEPGPEPNADAGHWNTLLRAAAGYHAYRREHPSGYDATEVACFLLANTAFPRLVGLNLAQIEWHLTQLRTRYFLRMPAALERLDQLNGMMTYQNVAELAGRKLSHFLDYVQREIGGLHQDIVETFAG